MRGKGNGADGSRRGISGWYAWLVVWLRWLIVPAWIAVVVLAVIYLPGTAPTGAAFQGLLSENLPAVRAQEEALRRFGIPLLSRTAMVQRAPGGLSSDAQARAVARAVELDIGTLKGVDGITFAVPIVNTFGLFPSSSEKGTTAITYLFFRSDLSSPARFHAAQHFAQQYVNQPDDHVVGLTGAVPSQVRQGDLITGALRWVTIATVLLVIVILGLRFRAVGAPAVTIIAAGIAYYTDTHVLAWTARNVGFGMPSQFEPLIVVLLLGIMTDYAIFYLATSRRELERGVSTPAAVRRAAAEVGPIVLSAGLAVAGGTATLRVARLHLVNQLGPAMAVTTVLGMLVAITFVPAVIAVFGRLLFWPAMSLRRRDRDGGEAAGGHDGGGLRRHLERAITARPVAAATIVLTAAALLAMSVPLRHTALAVNLIADLPGGEQPVRAADAAAQGFAPGIIAPTEILVTGPGVTGRRQALATFQRLVAQQPGVAGVIGPAQQPFPQEAGLLLATSGDAARYIVVFSNIPYGTQAIDDFRILKQQTPTLLGQAGLQGVNVAYAGDTAVSSELASALKSDLLRVALATLGVDLVILIVFLRALVAPLLVLGASILVVLASLGITTLVFGDFTFYVPFGAATLLLAFGSDYNIFIIGRIWETMRDKPLREAIISAGSRASSSISTAGLTLALSFALLAIVPVGSFRQFALAMALGVLVDTFVVRSFMVPALLALFGRLSGWPNTGLFSAHQAPRDD